MEVMGLNILNILKSFLIYRTVKKNEKLSQKRCGQTNAVDIIFKFRIFSLIVKYFEAKRSEDDFQSNCLSITSISRIRIFSLIPL